MQRHYPGAQFLSEKHMALVGLAVCAGRIYAPRAALVLGIVQPQRPAESVPQPAVIVVDQPMAADPAAWFNGAPPPVQ